MYFEIITTVRLLTGHSWWLSGKDPTQVAPYLVVCVCVYVCACVENTRDSDSKQVSSIYTTVLVAMVIKLYIAS